MPASLSEFLGQRLALDDSRAGLLERLMNREIPASAISSIRLWNYWRNRSERIERKRKRNTAGSSLCLLSTIIAGSSGTRRFYFNESVRTRRDHYSPPAAVRKLIILAHGHYNGQLRPRILLKHHRTFDGFKFVSRDIFGLVNRCLQEKKKYISSIRL